MIRLLALGATVLFAFYIRYLLDTGTPISSASGIAVAYLAIMGVLLFMRKISKLIKRVILLAILAGLAFAFYTTWRSRGSSGLAPVDHASIHHALLTR